MYPKGPFLLAKKLMGRKEVFVQVKEACERDVHISLMEIRRWDALPHLPRPRPAFFFFKKKQNRIPTLEYLSVFIVVVSALSLEAGSVFK